MYEKPVEISRNDDYVIENLLDSSYRQSYYKLICIDLPRQTNTSVPQQINFDGKLEEDDCAIIFLSLKSNKKLF